MTLLAGRKQPSECKVKVHHCREQTLTPSLALPRAFLLDHVEGLHLWNVFLVGGLRGISELDRLPVGRGVGHCARVLRFLEGQASYGSIVALHSFYDSVVELGVSVLPRKFLIE